MSARSFGGTPTGIPAPTSSFVGRRGELAQVRRLYEFSRLVTLVGVGGVGKTRLALRAAQEMSRAYQDGVWLADLTAVTDPDLIAPAVAAALGVRDQSTRAAADTVIAFLRGRRALLVIDNCEHVVEPVAELVDLLLRNLPELRILATSREALRVRGEHELVVLPLTIPGDDPSSRGVAESVRLLVDRARAVGVEVSPGDTEAGKLCRRLDGIPLAIELAAARLPTLGTLGDILARLDRDSLRVLTDGSAGLAPRHQQTMIGMLDWSHELVSPACRVLWSRLSVFVSRFDLTAAENICSDEELPADSVADTMAALVRQSIVLLDTSTGRGRYYLLEPLREYGRMKLCAAGEDAVFLRRHAEHYRARADDAAEHWFAADELTRLGEINRELPNYRAALDHALTAADSATALRIATSLARTRVWAMYGLLGEGLLWLLRAADLPGTTTPLRVVALSLATWEAHCQGDNAAADRILHRCLAASAECTARSPAEALLVEASVAFSLGNQDWITHRSTDALAKLTRAKQIFRDLGLTGDMHMAGLFLTCAAALLGSAEVSAEASTTTLAEATAAGAPFALAWAEFGVALHEWRHGDSGRATAIARGVLRKQYEYGDTWGVMWTAELLAWCAGPDLVRTARLMRVSERLQDVLGVVLAGVKPFADVHGRVVAQVQESTDPKVRKAWAESIALPLDDSIAIALGQDTPAQGAERHQSPGETGVSRLTLRPREAQVARLVAQGLTDRQIATILSLSPRTVETHVQRALRANGLRSRTQLATALVAADDPEISGQGSEPPVR